MWHLSLYLRLKQRLCKRVFSFQNCKNSVFVDKREGITLILGTNQRSHTVLSRQFCLTLAQSTELKTSVTTAANGHNLAHSLS